MSTPDRQKVVNKKYRLEGRARPVSYWTAWRERHRKNSEEKERLEFRPYAEAVAEAAIHLANMKATKSHPTAIPDETLSKSEESITESEARDGLIFTNSETPLSIKSKKASEKLYINEHEVRDEVMHEMSDKFISEVQTNEPEVCDEVVPEMSNEFVDELETVTEEILLPEGYICEEVLDEPESDPEEDPENVTNESEVTDHLSECLDESSDDDNNLNPDDRDSIDDDLSDTTIPNFTEDEVLHQMNEIKSVFIKHSLTYEAKDDVLKLLKNIKQETQEQLKKSSRYMRAPRLKHKIYQVDPGEHAYFGISNILNSSKNKLYDPTKRTIRLSINIDGLPILNGAFKLWPILGRIGKKRIFMISCYAGVGDPKCSNHFLKPFVEEVRILEKCGITVHGEKYKFAIDKLLMDAPAKAFILGTENHNSKIPCPKCHVVGISVRRRGYASKLKSCKAKRKANCILDRNAKEKVHSDFTAEVPVIPLCDPNNNCSHEDLNFDKDDRSVDYCHDDSTKDNYNNEDSIVESERKSEDSEAHKDENVSKCKKSKKHFRRHSTILTKLRIDLVRQVVIDYLHCVLLGVMGKLLKIWINNDDILSDENKKVFDKRIKLVCRPFEFQRIPEVIKRIPRYKGTQHRTFLLYVGVFVLRDLIPAAFYENFCYFVAAIRAMSYKVPSDETRQRYLDFVANSARNIIEKFVKGAAQLYGAEFLVHNVHLLWHIPTDFQNYGNLDEFSCFLFESFLGRLKRYIKCGFKPLQQVINVYSDLLGSNNYSTSESFDEFLHYQAEYFEEPTLIAQKETRLSQENSDNLEDAELSYAYFTELRFKNFRLKIKGVNSFCVLNIGDQKIYMRVTAIAQHKITKEIYLFGKCFIEKEEVFTKPCNSSDIGMLYCGKPSAQLYKFPISALKNKCFVFPTEDEKWAIVEYLH